MTPDFWIYFTILLASSGYGIFHFRKMPAWLKALTLICLLTLLNEIVGRILAYSIRNSSPPYHIYVVFCYLLQCYIYTKIYKKTGFIRNYAIITAIILCTFSLTNSIFIQRPLTFPSHAILLASIFTLILILSSFVLMLRSPGESPLLAEASFWFNTANLVLYTTSFLYFALYNILIASGGIPDIYESVIAVFTILAYTFYGISLYLGNKKATAHDNQPGK